METETLALFEHLSFEFLEEFDVFAPPASGRTRELQNTFVWLSCGFDRLPSGDAIDRFLTDLEHVVGAVFDHLVEQAARRGLLDLIYCTDSTDVRTMSAESRCVEVPRSNV